MGDQREVIPPSPLAVNGLYKCHNENSEQTYYIASQSMFMTDSDGLLTVLGLRGKAQTDFPQVFMNQTVKTSRPATSVAVTRLDENGAPQQFVCGTTSGHLSVLQRNGIELSDVRCHTNTVSFCQHNAFNGCVASGSWDNTISLTKLNGATANILTRWKAPTESGRVLCGRWAPSKVSSNAFIAGLEGANNSGEIVLYDIRSAQTPKMVIQHNSSIYSTCWPNRGTGHQIIAGDKFGSLMSWDLRQPAAPVVHRAKYHGRGPQDSHLRVGCSISSVDYNEEDGQILSTGTDRMFRYINIDHAQNGMGGMIQSKEFTTGFQSYTGGIAVAASLDGSIRLIKARMCQ